MNNAGDEERDQRRGWRVSRGHHRGAGGERAHLRAGVSLRRTAGAGVIRITGHIHTGHVGQGGYRCVSAAQNNSAWTWHEPDRDQRAAEQCRKQQRRKPAACQPALSYFVSGQGAVTDQCHAPFDARSDCAAASFSDRSHTRTSGTPGPSRSCRPALAGAYRRTISKSWPHRRA